MDQPIVRSDVHEMLSPSGKLEGLVEGMMEQHAPAHRVRSYQPTPWVIVNRILDKVDSVTNGRAVLVMRVISYLFFGGTAALVNLAVFYIARNYIPLHINSFVQNLFASALACEISLIANFIPNDYFTFRHLAGRERSWGMRCMRFHVTSLVGSGLTILLQLFFSHVVHMTPLLGEALALILVLFYNFSFHHLFTYRSVNKPAAAIH